MIIPFLKSIGFNESNLSFENNFTIKLGKSVAKKKDYISGRLDILIKIDNEPFLLWEVKRENLSITEEEINQAISYARLTESITPFTIVSNGIETKIYNTFNKEVIGKNEININYKHIKFEETIRLRLEALSDIICYSKENLINFLKNVNNKELERVIGNKYIKELYVQRKEICDRFEEFLKNDKKLFFITGESGVGKTNVICNLVEKYENELMILFYNSCFINNTLIDRIVEDFGFSFDEQLTCRQLLNRINLLAKKEDKYFVIFIDAIDELPEINPVIDIDRFLEIVSEYSNIKICLSCKESLVEVYEEINGVASKLRRMSKTNYKISGFNDVEKDEMIKKYKSYYNVYISEDSEEEVKQFCENGFLFRIIFEINRNQAINEKIDYISVMDKYVRIISKTYGINYKELIWTLEILGETFIKDTAFLPGLIIDESIVDSNLRRNNCKLTTDNLVDINLLQRYKSSYVDFNVKILSYYVITIIYGRINKKREREFKDTLIELNNNRRGKEALKWYDKYIKSFQYDDIYNFKMWYGLELIKEYREIVNKHFFSVRNRFKLNEDINNIGIALDDSNSCVVENYGFYIKRNPYDDVRLIDFSDENNLRKNGMHGQSGTMSPIDIPREVRDSVRNIIRCRLLNEEKCKYLIIEHVLNILSIFRISDKNNKTKFIHDYSEFLPVDLLNLRERIAYISINEFISYNIIDNNAYDNDLYRRVIEGKEEIPKYNYTRLHREFIQKYITINKINGLIKNFLMENINEKHLMFSKNLNYISDCNNMGNSIIESYSKDELIVYLNDLFVKFINEYIAIVENNFPLLKDKMIYYCMLKNGAIVNLFLYKETDSNFNERYFYNLDYYYNNENSTKIIVNVFDNEESRLDELYRLCKSYKGEAKELFISDFLGEGSYESMILSNMIYGMIDEDFTYVLKREYDWFE